MANPGTYTAMFGIWIASILLQQGLVVFRRRMISAPLVRTVPVTVTTHSAQMASHVLLASTRWTTA